MSRALPDWIASYLEYTDNQESPESYHFWTGMTLLASALKRRVWLHRVHYNLYPNLYTIIIASSATTRKSIPLEMGMSLLAEAIPDIYILSDSATPEGIIRYMNRSVTSSENGKKTISQESHLVLYADELASLFGYDKTRASKLSILLTRGYGCPGAYRHTTARDSMTILYNLYFNFIAATAPQNLKVLPDDAVGGLIGRLIIVSEKKRRKLIAWEDPNLVVDPRLREKLVADLYRISQLSGEFEVTPDARKFFTEWYHRQEEVRYDDPNLDAFHARCHDTALKLACLISVSRGDSLVLTESHVAAGISFVEKQLPEFSRIVTWAGATEHSQRRAKFFDLLKRAGGYMSRRALLRGMGLLAADFDALTGTLVQEGTVEVNKITGREMVFRLLESPESSLSGTETTDE